MDEINALWIESLKKNGEGYLQVKGKSMEPAVKVGERLKISSVEPEKVNIGNVVVFSPSPCPLPSFYSSPLEGERRLRKERERVREDEEFVIHRVVDKFKFRDRLYFVHRGDKAGLLGMSIFGEDQLVGVTEGFKTPGQAIVKNTQGWSRYANYLLRKFFIYFFIFKQLIKCRLGR